MELYPVADVGEALIVRESVRKSAEVLKKKFRLVVVCPLAITLPTNVALVPVMLVGAEIDTSGDAE